MVLSGSHDSMRSAFVWQKGAIVWYLRCDYPPPEWKDAFLSCLESFIQLLQANSSSGQRILDMQYRREDFLVVGAGMAALDVIDPSQQLVHWVHGHNKVHNRLQSHTPALALLEAYSAAFACGC